MKWPTCGTPPRGSWSTGLYFQLCTGLRGQELRLFATDTMYRWGFPLGLPGGVGDRGVAEERPPVGLGGRTSERPVMDEGFAFIEPYERGAHRHFLDGYLTGELTLSLAGVRVWGTFYLLRTSELAGEGAFWAVCRLMPAERVA